MNWCGRNLGRLIIFGVVFFMIGAVLTWFSLCRTVVLFHENRSDQIKQMEQSIITVTGKIYGLSFCPTPAWEKDSYHLLIEGPPKGEIIIRAGIGDHWTSKTFQFSPTGQEERMVTLGPKPRIEVLHY